MTKDTIEKTGNAIALFSDPFERAARELFAEPVLRPRRRRGDDARDDRDALEFELGIDGRRIVADYAAAIEKEDADGDECLMQCAKALAAVVGIDPDDFFGHRCDFTFGTLQHLVNKTELFAYVGHFWHHMGSPLAELDARRLEDWFLAPDSPRRKFRKCHCPMDDETLDRAVREYRRSGTNRLILQRPWDGMEWRKLGFAESGDRYSVVWYDLFQAMVSELAGRLDLYPVEFFLCCQSGTGFDFGI